MVYLIAVPLFSSYDSDMRKRDILVPIQLDPGGEDLSPLGFLRHTLDHRRPGSTYGARVLTIVRFCMTSQYPETDPLTYLSPYLRQGDELTTWYVNQAEQLDRIRREDRRNQYTDHHDLQEAIEPYRQSAWLRNSEEAVRMMPLAAETNGANIVMKVLYRDARDAYRDLSPSDTPAA